MDEIEKRRMDVLYENLSYFLKGDEWAIRLCLDLFFVAQVWDDLIDKDKKVPDKNIHDAFRLTMVVIPANPFYVKFGTYLRPLILNTILRWQDANVLERGDISKKHLAFVHRAGIYDIFNLCAYLIGGVDWAETTGPAMRQLYGEKFEDFVEEMNNA